MSLYDLEDLPILFPRSVSVLPGTVLQDLQHEKPSRDVQASVEPAAETLDQERTCKTSKSTPYGSCNFGSLNELKIPQL